MKFPQCNDRRELWVNRPILASRVDSRPQQQARQIAGLVLPFDQVFS